MPRYYNNIMYMHHAAAQYRDRFFIFLSESYRFLNLKLLNNYNTDRDLNAFA